MSKVHVWYMTKDELAEYVKKHPIIPTKKPRRKAFENIHTDYRWPWEQKSERGEAMTSSFNRQNREFVK